MSTLLKSALLGRLARAAGLATKAVPGFALYAEGRPTWTARDPAALARAGYARNPVVHRAVRLVAESAASLPLSAAAGEGDGLLALLARPNPREGGAGLLETVYADLMLAGTAALWSKCTKTKKSRLRAVVVLGAERAHSAIWIKVMQPCQANAAKAAQSLSLMRKI